MNVNSRFDSVNEIKVFLNTFNEEDWAPEYISPDNIQKFITNNLKILANQQDRELHDQLMKLSDRISNEWSHPKANILAFEIMGIAKGVFNNGKESPKLLDELWREILSHIPPRAPGTPDIPAKKGGLPSRLEDLYPSRRLSEIAHKEENKWAGEELVSLKKYGCKTAVEAVQYTIDHKLTGANLREFPDLNENDLISLFEKCPTLNQLMIESDNIRSLPAKAKVLKVLNCSGCENLENLGELPQIQKLNCHGCMKMLQLPGDMPKVQVIDCSQCESLLSLPELPQVQWLDCSACLFLEVLPQLLRVQELNCSYNTLQSLPELPEVQKLRCISCRDLQNLPELPKVQELYCKGCVILQSLPELPEIQVLDCRWCKNLENLPELPEGTEVYH